MSRLNAELTAMVNRRKRETMDHYNLAFRQIWNFYDPDHHLILMLDDDCGKAVILHPREPNIKHIFPYSNAGIVAADDTIAMMMEQLDIQTNKTRIIQTDINGNSSAITHFISQKAIDVSMAKDAAAVLESTLPSEGS